MVNDELVPYLIRRLEEKYSDEALADPARKEVLYRRYALNANIFYNPTLKDTVPVAPENLLEDGAHILELHAKPAEASNTPNISLQISAVG